MGKDLAEKTKRFIEWTNEGNAAAGPLVDELLELPSDAWDAWFASHPEARTVHVLQQLVRIAKKNPPDGLLLTDFVLRHIDSIPPPAEAEVVHTLVRARAWKARAVALRHAGDEQGALQASEKSKAIAPFLPLRQRRATEDEIRRFEELSQKYGWDFLRTKG